MNKQKSLEIIIIDNEKIVFAYNPRHRTKLKEKGATVVQLLDLGKNGCHATLLSADFGTRPI